MSQSMTSAYQKTAEAAEENCHSRDLQTSPPAHRPTPVQRESSLQREEQLREAKFQASQRKVQRACHRSKITKHEATMQVAEQNRRKQERSKAATSIGSRTAPLDGKSVSKGDDTFHV